MKFVDWLVRQTGRDDAIGDLARDALKDGFRNGGVGALAERLLIRGACDSAHSALHRADEEFRQARREARA